MNEPLLQQKIEFLEFELKQYKNKEKTHEKMNDSLMQILGKSEENLLNVIIKIDSNHK